MKTFFILVVFIALLFLAATIVQFVARVFMGKTLVSQATPFERLPALPAQAGQAGEKVGTTLHFLVIGDSTGVGVGVSDPRFSVAGRLGSEFPNASVRNLSRSGARTAELLPLLEEIPSKSFDFVLFQIGANDVIRFTSYDNLRRDIAAVLKEGNRIAHAQALITAGNIGLAPIFPWPLSVIYTHRTRIVREMFMDAAKESGTVYVDLFREKGEEPFEKDVARYYAPDREHLSDEGYGYWFEALTEALRESPQPFLYGN